eukprot:g3477.t1
MDALKQSLAHFEAQVDKAVEDIELLNMLSQKTKLPRARIVLGAGLFAFALFWAFLGMPFICDVVGFFYPTYMSFKAIESSNTEDDRHWLTYWVVFAFLSVVEVGANIILSWFSYYYYVKLAFLVYCFHPEYKGAEKIYELIIRPLMKRYESQVDASVKVARKRVEMASEFAKANASKAANAAGNLVQPKKTQ